MTKYPAGWYGHEAADIVFISGSQGIATQRENECGKWPHPKKLDSCDVDIMKATSGTPIHHSANAIAQQIHLEHWSEKRDHPCWLIGNLCPHHHKSPSTVDQDCVKKGFDKIREYLRTRKPQILVWADPEFLQGERFSKLELAREIDFQQVEEWKGRWDGGVGCLEEVPVIVPAYKVSAPYSRVPKKFGRRTRLSYKEWWGAWSEDATRLILRVP